MMWKLLCFEKKKKKRIMDAELSCLFWAERWNEKQAQLKNVLRQHKKVILPCLPKETILKAAMKYALHKKKQKQKMNQTKKNNNHKRDNNQRLSVLLEET